MKLVPPSVSGGVPRWATVLRRTPSLLAVAIVGILLTSLSPQARAERTLQFNGSGSVVLPALSQLKFAASNDFALELWIKPSATDLGAVFTSDNYGALLAPDGAYGGWGLYAVSGGLRIAKHPSSSPTSPSLPGGNAGNLISAAVGSWHHVVVNFKRTDAIALYVDGVLRDTSESIASWAYFQRTFDSVNAYRLGMDPAGTNGFRGQIDEVRLWGRLRSPSEINNAYSQRPALNGTEPGLLLYYQFNEASGNAAPLGSLILQGTATVTGATRLDDAGLILTPALPAATDFALAFDGVNQSLETQIGGDKLAGNELTIEYWFKGSRLQSAVRLQSSNRWVVSGWGSPPQQIINTTGSNNLTLGISSTTPGVQDGLWHHVALTWKRNVPNGFKSYLDGLGSAGLPTGEDPFPLLGAKVWLGSLNGTSEFLQGQLDEVRIWNRALTPEEIQEHYTTPRTLLGGDPGLVAYFTFNDANPTGTMDTTGKQLATFRNLTAASRQVQDKRFADAALLTSPNPLCAGLWLGEISLKRVNEVFAGSTTPTNLTAAGGQFDSNILLHANGSGAVRLLKDVTVMQKSATSGSTELVLVTDDTLLPNFDGVLKRSGKLVGVRYSSPFFQFDGQSWPLVGGLGYGFRVVGTNTIAANSPLNPFRHRFHPQHKAPADLQGVAYDLTREFEIIFLTKGKVGASDGRDRYTGTYRETIRGLHKVPLIAEGDISIERVSLVNKLNNQ